MSELTEVIRAAGKAEPKWIGNLWGRRATEDLRDEIHSWRFPVYGRDTDLRPPIDWRADPYGDRSWRYELHTLQYLEIACRFYDAEGDSRALHVALDVATDWASQNLDASTVQLSEFAWYDMAAGIRAPLLAYLLRAGVWGQAVDGPTAELLLATLERHGDFLADSRNYYERHNHGLFQDRGLLGMCHLVPFLDRAAEWAELARERFAQTLSETVDDEDGVHLEHSPAYHFTAFNLVREVTALDDTLGSRLARARSRMEEAAGWLVMPSGRCPPVGDTVFTRAPTWARERSRSNAGARAFVRAGYAAARHDECYLLLSAGYHARAHKHADEVSFVLEERGALIIADTGCHSYSEDHPARVYARSALAHNTLVVDGLPFDWRSSEPYGSGVVAAGSAEPLLAMQARNPLLQACHGVDHWRTLIYWPRHAILVIDELISQSEHAYTRFFHFGPDVEVADTSQPGVSFRHAELSGCLVDPSRTDTRVDRAFGETNPYSGWFFPRDGESFPVCTVALHNDAGTACLVTLLTLDGARQPAAEAHRAGRRLAFNMASEDHLAGHIERRGVNLLVSLA